MKKEISIKKSRKSDLKDSLKIAENLPKWFTKKALENIDKDFKINKSIVALKNKKIVGFLCYSLTKESARILWMGVSEGEQGKGIGKLLIKFLTKESKKKGINFIEVKTLTDKDDYMPYKKTRKFYKSLGFIKSGYEKARFKGWDDQIILEKKL